jgi:Zn-dependent protease with chaperone function
MRLPAVSLLCLLAAACGPAYEIPVAGGGAPVAAAVSPGWGGRTAGDFARVASRVEPAAEAFCRSAVSGAPPAYCDFRVLLETDPRMPPNALQTRGEDGRPIVVVGARLLSEMRSDDELAFVLSHEMAHQIAGHIGKQQQQQVLGAVIMGGLVAAAGNGYGGAASQDAIARAMDVGAYLGARAYSQSYELEADILGTYVTARAGYSPERGADIFGRPALANPGGPPILASHPGSAQRQAVVAQVATEVRRQQALGLVPDPRNAGSG